MEKMFWKKGVDVCSSKSMWNFLHDHPKYDTMNSWNGLKSVAHCVKLHKLKLEGDWYKAYELLDNSDWCDVNDMIYEWEELHPGYSVGFNGRSGGYLVLYNKSRYIDVLPDYISGYTYDEYKEYCVDYYGTVKNHRSNLRYYVDLVRDFDKLCDDLREYVNELSKMEE